MSFLPQTEQERSMEHDVIIIGGSFAGLSATLYLARVRRSVIEDRQTQALAGQRPPLDNVKFVGGGADQISAFGGAS